MRDERNCIGLPTKRSPTEYLFDRDMELIKQEVEPAMVALRKQLEDGRIVVWPKAGIGTGLARLAEKAPAIARFYDEVLAELAAVP